MEKTQPGAQWEELMEPTHTIYPGTEEMVSAPLEGWFLCLHIISTVNDPLRSPWKHLERGQDLERAQDLDSLALLSLGKLNSDLFHC